MRRSRLDYDGAARIGAWQASIAGRNDSDIAPVQQRASWTGTGLIVRAGDLAAWSEAPLLEGGSRRSGEGHFLRRIGSGNAVAGIDAAAVDPDLLPWPVSIRSRMAASPRGTTRSSVLASFGVFRAGLASSSGQALRPSGGLHIESGSSRLEADILADRSSRGFVASATSSSEDTRHDIELRHVDHGLAHDGLPVGWAGATHAQAESRWSGESSSMGLSGVVDDDSCGCRTTRFLGDLSREHMGFEARLRGRWDPSPSRDMFRLTPGVSRASGLIRPWTEIVWTIGRPFSHSLGARWVGRELRADVSATRRNGSEWNWRIASSLGKERAKGGSRLEIVLSGAEQVQQGGGSWTSSW